jgi:hypothetical protein
MYKFVATRPVPTGAHPSFYLPSLSLRQMRGSERERGKDSHKIYGLKTNGSCYFNWKAIIALKTFMKPISKNTSNKTDVPKKLSCLLKEKQLIYALTVDVTFMPLVAYFLKKLNDMKHNIYAHCAESTKIQSVDQTRLNIISQIGQRE